MFGALTSTYWNIINFGRITAVGSAATGVLLEGGGTVINGAYISGGKQGVSIGLGAGTVVNEGGVIAATATQSTGVYLHAGGTATNKDLITGPRVTIADLFYVS